MADTSQEAESALEHDHLLLLEFDRRVATFAAQPITLCWEDASGRHRYTPDVAIRYTAPAMRADPSLCTTLIEVKPRSVLRRDWVALRPKFKATIAWCNERSMAFRILTDAEIRTPYLENARFLLRFRFDTSAESCIDDPCPLQIRRALIQQRISSPRALMQSLATDEQRQAEYLPWIWRLVDLGHIGCDLHQRLTMTSLIWATNLT